MAESFDRFSVLFADGKVFAGGKALPLGQCTVDILNLEDAVLTKLDQQIGKLFPAVDILLKEKTDSAAYSAQEQLNAVWGLIYRLPLYRDMEMDLYTARNLLPLMLSEKEKWAEVQDEASAGHAMFQKFMDMLEYFPERLRVFRGQIMSMMVTYLEPLKRRSVDAYAAAFARYYAEMKAAEPLFGEDSFEQSFPMETRFVPLVSAAEGSHVVLAEQRVFSFYTHFLYTDFYRGLIAGNAPRCCHNCNSFFLLTAGYNTCYCNNIAPGETERTCRKVGAHKKEAQGRAAATPAQKEYSKAYIRLKARKQRGKITTDQWNAAVAKAQELKAQNERGELSDEELAVCLLAL